MKRFILGLALMIGVTFNCYADKCLDAIQSLEDINKNIKTYSFQVGGSVATEDALGIYDEAKSKLDAFEQKWKETIEDAKKKCKDV